MQKKSALTAATTGEPGRLTRCTMPDNRSTPRTVPWASAASNEIRDSARKTRMTRISRGPGIRWMLRNSTPGAMGRTVTRSPPLPTPTGTTTDARTATSRRNMCDCERRMCISLLSRLAPDGRRLESDRDRLMDLRSERGSSHGFRHFAERRPRQCSEDIKDGPPQQVARHESSKVFSRPWKGNSAGAGQDAITSSGGGGRWLSSSRRSPPSFLPASERSDEPALLLWHP